MIQRAHRCGASDTNARGGRAVVAKVSFNCLLPNVSRLIHGCTFLVELQHVLPLAESSCMELLLWKITAPKY